MREDWEEVELGQVLIQSKEKHKPEKTESLFYIGLEHIEKSTGCLTDSVGLAEIKTVKNKFRRGQLLYGKLRPYLNKVYLSNSAGVCSTDILVFEVSQAVLGKFALLLMLSRKFVNDMSENTNGVNLPRVSTKYVNAYPFPIPPLPEQRAIVAKIEELFSDLDKGIADLKKAQDQLKVYRQAVLKKAFEGELTKEWREQQTDLPTADELLEKIKVERQKHYEQQLNSWNQSVKTWEEKGKNGKKPTRPTKIKETIVLDVEEAKEFDYIPENWFILEMQGIADKITDGTHHTPTYTDDGVKFISVKDIYSEQVHFDNCKYISQDEHKQLIKRCHPESGDILITKSGTIGRMAIVPDIEFSLFVSVALMKVQSTKHLFHSKWIYYAVKFHLMGLNIDQDIKGGLLKNYHLEDLRLAKLIMVPLLEQHQIVQEIESRLSVCDKVEESITESLEKAKALRQSILKKAFEGTLLSEEEIAACKAAPDYEPASVLLEKIKAEKKK